MHVRRIGHAGATASDSEILHHYRALLRQLGGNAIGEWSMGMALALAGDRVHAETLVQRSWFVATPSPVVVPAMALRSLQVNPASTPTECASGRAGSWPSSPGTFPAWQRRRG